MQIVAEVSCAAPWSGPTGKCSWPLQYLCNQPAGAPGAMARHYCCGCPHDGRPGSVAGHPCCNPVGLRDGAWLHGSSAEADLRRAAGGRQHAAAGPVRQEVAHLQRMHKAGFRTSGNRTMSRWWPIEDMQSDLACMGFRAWYQGHTVQYMVNFALLQVCPRMHGGPQGQDASIACAAPSMPARRCQTTC